MSVLDRKELEQSPLADLHAIASELGVEGFRRMRKDDLIKAILKDQGDDEDSTSDRDPEELPDRDRAAEAEAVLDHDEDARPDAQAEEDEDEEDDEDEEEDKEPDEEPAAESEEEDVRTGVLDILPNGSGFMRPDPFAHSRDDVYVSPAQIRRCELRAGDEISGPVRPPRRSERYPSLVRIDTVNGQPPEPPPERLRFEDLTAVFATEKLPTPDGLDSAPFGKGSRVAIAGPPGSGATTTLRQIVTALADSSLEPVVVLAGVRPEELTEWRRETGITVAGGAFDGSTDEQAQVAEMAVERAKRAVEQGRDAVVVVDSLDSLPAGVARRVFGAARKAEEGGSLTVIAATGESTEPLRVATTRIVLDGGSLSAKSGTTRADLLG
ncbi:MAG TPA: Rho termination factor N-terminal domain-containing protein [Solirubrobacteraceae bacterium]|jgi:transcription termination factor Rho|nr:Rho termination factor N-terminal domain-containing protein [Solirubrobacteraceae bacterium]